MQVWVDADACPRPIKDILHRAADRERIHVTFVANRSLHVPRSTYLHTCVVPGGFDVADAEIVKRLEAGDLVVTADIPLASQAVERGAHVIDPRGEHYTEENIGERLSVRDFMDELRASGVTTGGPAAFGAADRQAFANQLDRMIRKHHRPEE